MANIAKLVISTEDTVVLALSGAQAVKDRDTGEPRMVNGLPIHTVSVALLYEDSPALIEVRVIGEVPPLTAGTPVEVTGLTVRPWEMNGKHGLSFQAEAIRPISPSRAVRTSTGGDA